METSELIVRRVLEEPWAGDFGAIDRFVAPDYVGNDPSEPEPIRGPDGLKAFVERYRSAFAGARLTVDDQVAEGDKVASRWTARGTHTGEIAGIGPTGKDVTVSGHTSSRLAGGRIVEQWTTWDTLGMLIQLGVVPSSAATEVH